MMSYVLFRGYKTKQQAVSRFPTPGPVPFTHCKCVDNRKVSLLLPEDPPEWKEATKPCNTFASVLQQNSLGPEAIIINLKRIFSALWWAPPRTGWGKCYNWNMLWFSLSKSFSTLCWCCHAVEQKQPCTWLCSYMNNHHHFSSHFNEERARNARAVNDSIWMLKKDANHFCSWENVFTCQHLHRLVPHAPVRLQSFPFSCPV